MRRGARLHIADRASGLPQRTGQPPEARRSHGHPVLRTRRAALKDALLSIVADGSGKHYLRLCYSVEPPDALEEGIRRLARALDAAAT